MEQHPIPRQVISFEFKLVGILTVKQFAYSLIFALIAGLIFISVKVVILNIFLVIVTVVIGAFFVLVKYNERSMDVWVKNFIYALTQPIQYYYLKKNLPPSYLVDIYIPADPQIIENHVDAHRKLSTYIASTTTKDDHQEKKQNITNLINQTPVSQDKTGSASTPQNSDAINNNIKKTDPFIFGLVKNSKSAPLGGILVYVKDPSGQVIRILKTNHNGIFASYRPFPDGTYSFEAKDLSGKYFFDTMEILVLKSAKGKNEMISIFSREVL